MKPTARVIIRIVWLKHWASEVEGEIQGMLAMGWTLRSITHERHGLARSMIIAVLDPPNG